MEILLPIPIPPPVTIMVLPSREKGDGVMDEVLTIDAYGG
jgi:hypothetical protein